MKVTKLEILKHLFGEKITEVYTRGMWIKCDNPIVEDMSVGYLDNEKDIENYDDTLGLVQALLGYKFKDLEESKNYDYYLKYLTNEKLLEEAIEYGLYDKNLSDEENIRNYIETDECSYNERYEEEYEELCVHESELIEESVELKDPKDMTPDEIWELQFSKKTKKFDFKLN